MLANKRVSIALALERYTRNPTPFAVVGKRKDTNTANGSLVLYRGHSGVDIVFVFGNDGDSYTFRVTRLTLDLDRCSDISEKNYCR